MKEITTLEIEIMRLERYLLSLYRTALPLVLENNQKIKISSPTQCTTHQSYSDVEMDTCADLISAAHALAGVSDQIQTAKNSSSIRVNTSNSYTFDIYTISIFFQLELSHLSFLKALIW